MRAYYIGRYGDSMDSVRIYDLCRELIEVILTDELIGKIQKMTPMPRFTKSLRRLPLR